LGIILGEFTLSGEFSRPLIPHPIFSKNVKRPKNHLDDFVENVGEM
jgi:hypothetical protein